jgi:hypothetical protein
MYQPHPRACEFFCEKDVRHLATLGTLADKLNRVFVKEIVSASVIEQYAHDVSDLCAGGTGQGELPQPRLDRFDSTQLVLAPFGDDPPIQVNLVSCFRRICLPEIISRQLPAPVMVGELSDG